MKEQQIVTLTESDDRVTILDSMRGYFILWIGIFNTLNILNNVYPNLIFSSILYLINDKGWFCLSAIFGYSFGILLKKEKNGASLFLKRMTFLFCLGLLNSFLYYGDILKDYAIVGILIYLLRNLLLKHRVLVLLLFFTLTIISLLTVDYDMKNIGNLSDYIKSGFVLISNFKYSIHINLVSKYYLICYHLEMILLVLLGFYASYFGLEKSLLWNFKKVNHNFYLFICLDLIALFLIFSDVLKEFRAVLYFIHILTFSLWYMTGFYILVNGTKLNTVLSRLGKRTLSLYLIQNIVLCSFWFLSDKQLSKGLFINGIYYFGIQLSIVFTFFIGNKLILKNKSLYLIP